MGKGQAAEETGWRPEQKGIVKKEESPLRQHGEGDLVHFRELGVYGRLQRLTSVCSGPPQPISLPFSPRLTAFFAVGCCLILAGGMRVAVRYAAQPSKIPLLPLSLLPLSLSFSRHPMAGDADSEDPGEARGTEGGLSALSHHLEPWLTRRIHLPLLPFIHCSFIH